MREMNLEPNRPRRDVSPRTPGRAHPYLLGLVQYLEENLSDVTHFYQGGFFIGEYTKEPRYTQDVDMSITELSSYERVKQVLNAYGTKLQEAGTISKYLVKSEASERHSGGAKFYAPDGSVLFSVDIGFHEKPLRTVAIEMNDVGRVSITTVEQMLCDKLSALFSDRRQRRIKDLFDAWHILTTCSVDVNELILCLDQRGLYPLKSEDGPFTYSHIMTVEDAYGRLVVYDVGAERERKIPMFSDIVEVVGSFCARLSDSEV